jgi:plasmid maintenance system killer protein
LLEGGIIKIAWADHKLERSCTGDRAGKKRWGGNWKLLQRRLASLLAAPTLKDMDGAPGRCHPLSADRDGDFAVHLWGAYRLVFAPDDDPVPLLADGGIDTEHVTSIVIKEVVDYHGR